jgi:hypothetical protein
MGRSKEYNLLLGSKDSQARQASQEVQDMAMKREGERSSNRCIIDSGRRPRAPLSSPLALALSLAGDLFWIRGAALWALVLSLGLAQVRSP